MILCVTGPMAAGKNAVCNILAASGFVCIDADSLVHSAIEKASSAIVNAFSGEALKAGISLKNTDGTLNRRELGKLLFSRPELLAVQEGIVFPLVTEEALKTVSTCKNKNIILNAAVLYKTPGLMQLCSRIIYVDSPVILRLLRARKRDRISFRQIFARFRSQDGLFSEYKKTGIPITKISNTGSRKKLYRNLKKLTEAL